MTTTPPPPPGSQEQPAYGTTWQDPQHPPTPGQPSQQGWGPGHPPAPPVPPQPEPAQKSWFRRHKVMTALLAIVALLVVGSLFGGEDEETPAAGDEPAAAQQEAPAEAPESQAEEAEPGAENAAAQEEPAEEEPAKDEPAQEEPAEEAPVEEAPGVGDAVRDGDFEFTVNEVQTGLTSIGEGFTEETPQGQFVLIDITVTNIGDKGTALLDSNQVLIDEQGRQHNTSSASMWLEEGLWLDEINPGNSVSGVLLYDIPTDAVPTTLELHDSMFSGGVTVTLR